MLTSGERAVAMQTEANQVTMLIQRWAAGDASALDDLIPVVYADLRRSALRLLRQERYENTFQCTSLVHEFYLRLLSQQGLSVANRAHFLTIAARLMRQSSSITLAGVADRNAAPTRCKCRFPTISRSSQCNRRPT